MKYGTYCVKFIASSVVLMVFMGCSILGAKDESGVASITSLKFNMPNYTIAVGEVIAVPVSMMPEAARTDRVLTYSSSNADIVSITNETTSGIVVTGQSPGNTVIMVKNGNFIDYCEVRVSGTVVIDTPYIIVPNQALEITEGNRRSFSVSLYGGSATDNNNFIWSVDKDAIAGITTTGNTAVIDAKSAGTARITIQHPKAQYSVDVIVFVVGLNKPPLYITTDQNVLTTYNGGANKQLKVTLVGGEDLDKMNFTYEVLDDTGVITILGANDTCNITPVKSGVARIKISNPKAEYALEILVIVTDIKNTTYIEVDNSFVILSGQSAKMVTATFVGDVSSTAYMDFSYTLTNSDVVNVSQINNSFYVTGVISGSTKMTITNTNVNYSREVLFIVQDQESNIVSNENYITTSQNIVQLELGQTPMQLDMALVGGTEADKNNFSWTVDNSAIISVDTAEGNVSYVRSATVERYDAKALITPKTSGTTKITVTHPKSSVGTTVIVKVYPKGTFSSTPVILQSASSLIKIETGNVVTHELTMASGTPSDVGILSWSIAESNIATVIGNTLSGVISGIQGGVSSLVVAGDNLYKSYTATVLVGTPVELASKKTIYVDNKYITIINAQTSYVQIKSNNDLLLGNDQFIATVEDGSIVYARMVKDVLILQGLKEGQTEVLISNSTADNTIAVYVTVERGDVSIDFPYYMTGENFIGIVKGDTKTIAIDLVGAPAIEQSKIKWSVEAPGIATVIGNGIECSVSGESVGQTKIMSTHVKSADPKETIVYVANTQAELDAMFVMVASVNNVLLEKGKNTFIKLTTTGTEAQKQNITWTVDDISVLSIDDNYDSAYIAGLNAGNAVITVSHPLAPVPIKIYVSVKDGALESEGKAVNVPSIVEMLVGDSKVIEPALIGFTESDKNNIVWATENASLVTITGTGDKAYVQAKTQGQAYVTMTYTPLNYTKRILVVVSKTEDIQASTYVMAVDKTFDTYRVNEEKTINILFGLAGFPENEYGNIVWSATANNVLSVIGNGKKAQVVAKNEGIAIITVTHPLCATPITIKIEVANPATIVIPNQYSFVIDKLKGMVINSSTTMTALLYDESSTEITTGLSAIVWSIDDPTIATITPNASACIINSIKTGQTYITITHPNVPEPTKILVYVVATAAELTNAYPLATGKTNYLLNVGQTAVIDISTIDSNATQIAKIMWNIESTTYINYAVQSKIQVSITGKKAGNTKITITHPNSSVPVVVYISVKDVSAVDPTKNIVTESIIGMVNGANRSTSIQTNLTEYEKSELVWESANTGIVAVVGSGANATLTANGVGETTVTVTYNTFLKRTILVYVASSQVAVDAYKAMNIDKTYYKIARGEQITCNMFYAPNRPLAGNTTSWTDVYENNVISVAGNGDKAVITGVNQGISIVRAQNASCLTPVYITVEVTEQITGVVQEDTTLRYLSAIKTIYVVDPTKLTDPTNITITPIGFTDTEVLLTNWTNNNPDIINMTGNGAMGIVYPNKTGTATITITNPKSQNMLTLTIVVGDQTTIINDTVAYISVDTPVVKMVMGEEKNITCTMNNFAGVDISKYTISFDKQDSISATITGNIIKILPKISGQTLLTISHPSSSYTTNVVVIVTSAGDAPVIYLTTSQNFVKIEKGKYQNVAVKLMGYEELNANNFTWTSYDENIATIAGSGNSVVVTGHEIGTARIEVKHIYSNYALDLYVRVTAENTAPPVYISTATNIVSLVKNKTTSLTVSLENGSLAENNLFKWSTTDNDVVALTSSSQSAVVKGLKAGVATILITHPSSLNTINIVVMVEEDMTTSGIYITSDLSLIEMKPTDSSKSITARLIGGNPEDIYGFVWSVKDFTSVVKYADGTNKPVIQLVASADCAYISPKNEGEATIEITHPRTGYKLNIKVSVQLYNEINFSTEALNVDQNNTEAVTIQVPSTEQVIYESSAPLIATVSGTNKVCLIEGLKPGVAIITARTASGNSSDEIIVQVKAVEAGATSYITSPTNLVTMIKTQAAQALTATLVGVGVTPEMQDSLVWTSQNTAIATIFGSGKNVTVSPVAVGETVINITHASVPGYIKRIYVRVDADDISYTISDALLLMTELDEKTISVNLTNASDVDYQTNMVWTTSDSSVVTILPINGKDCYLVARKAGSATITGLYSGTARTCTVVVSQPKTLTVSSTAVAICPGETRVIPYDVAPVGSTVTVQSNTANYITYTHDPVAKTITVVGKPLEGYTTLTLTANGLVAAVTIHTNYNYYFTSKQASIRGVPNKTYTIEYEINPKGSNVIIEDYPDDLLSSCTVDTANQVVTVVTKASGSSKARGDIVLNFEGKSIRLNIPVYIYYSDLVVDFSTSVVSTSTPVTPHSQVDNNQMAIYLADGETINFSLLVNNTLYPAHGTTMLASEYRAAGKTPLVTVGTNGHGMYAYFAGDTGNASEYRKSTTFVGYLDVKYAIWDGNDNAVERKKTYMVYSEIWRRK